MNEILVIDIGGTKTNVSLVGTFDLEKIKILSSEIFPTHSNPEHTIQKISSIYKNQELKLENISLSLPGKWSKDRVLQESYFLGEWLNFPFVSKLAEELKIKNYTWETDVICGALGEYNSLVETYHGMSLLYLNLGTGIGAALIKDGKPYKSNSKLTLRMQKLVLPFQDELYSAVDLISGGSLQEASGYESIEALYKDYKLAKIEALNIIAGAQTQLAAWIINLFYLFVPDVIVLNGGLTYDWEVLAQGAVDLAYEELEGEVKILPSKLEEQAPVYGAYMNFLCHLKSKSLLLIPGFLFLTLLQCQILRSLLSLGNGCMILEDVI